MTRQENYSTVEPMTEAEAMQAARENMVYLEQFAYLVWSRHDRGIPFLEARKSALEEAEKKGDDFVHYAVPEEIYPPETLLAYCFPELTGKNIAAVLKWKRKRDRVRTRSEGRRSRRKNLWRILGESHWRADRLLIESGFSEEANCHADRFMVKTGDVPGEEGSPEKHLNTLERKLKVIAVFQHMINQRYSGRRFTLPTMATYRPRTSSRTPRRSPVRSAAKSGGDDNGGDGDSDCPGEPPRPKLAVPSSHNLYSTLQVNSFPHSRIVHPCSWCMGGRWAA